MLVALLLIAATPIAELEPRFEAYLQMKITLDRNTIKAKVSEAEVLRTKYLSIIEGASPDEALAAGARIGEIDLNLAESIRATPLPAGLTDDQNEIYQAELDAYAVAPEERAIAAFDQVMLKAKALSISNRWTKLAENHLRRLRPDRFPPSPPPPVRPASDGEAALRSR